MRIMSRHYLTLFYRSKFLARSQPYPHLIKLRASRTLMKKFTLLVLSILFLNVSHAANEKYGAMVALKAFECFQYAKYAGDQSAEDRERLFTYGVSRARAFLDHAKKNTEKAAEMFEEAPWIFRHMVGGPSTDFVVGRWFEFSVDGAFDRILKNIDEEKYKHDNEFQAMAAQKLYFDSSCSTLGR